jgi:hypothetical protein
MTSYHQTRDPFYFTLKIPENYWVVSPWGGAPTVWGWPTLVNWIEKK